MPILVHTNENKESTYFLTKDDKQKTRICFCHEEYPAELRTDRLGAVYGSEHKVTQAEADRLAIVIRGGNLTVKPEPKKKASK